jgi:type II secretory pathway pseudopilin PulG
MRISAIGKANSGFTLIEILGVILLLGLALTLVQPKIFQVEEKQRVRYAGELLQADLERIQAEAKAGNTVTLRFNANGYCFSLGDNVVSRDYRVNGLIFKAIGPGVSATSAKPSPNGAAAADIGQTTDANPTEAELCFTPDCAGPQATVSWASGHYQGVMTLQADDAVSWRYHGK